MGREKADPLLVAMADDDAPADLEPGPDRDPASNGPPVEFCLEDCLETLELVDLDATGLEVEDMLEEAAAAGADEEEGIVGGMACGACDLDAPGRSFLPADAAALGEVELSPAAAAAAALLWLLAIPGANEESAAFMRFPTLDPLRNDSEVRFSAGVPALAVSPSRIFLAVAEASRHISLWARISMSSVISADALLPFALVFVDKRFSAAPLQRRSLETSNDRWRIKF